MVSDPVTRHSFLHSISNSGETQDIYFNAASLAKIIIICEKNYSRENNQRFIVDVRQGSEYVSDFEYASVLNIAGF